MRGTSKNTINERICAIRYTLDLSQRKFGEVIGVGLGTVARMKKQARTSKKRVWKKMRASGASAHAAYTEPLTTLTAIKRNNDFELVRKTKIQRRSS